jgi:hypothetical protein
LEIFFVDSPFISSVPSAISVAREARWGGILHPILNKNPQEKLRLGVPGLRRRRAK